MDVEDEQNRILLGGQSSGSRGIYFASQKNSFSRYQNWIQGSWIPSTMRRSTSAVGWSTSDRLAGSVEDEDVLRAPETPEETGPFLRRQFYKP